MGLLQLLILRKVDLARTVSKQGASYKEHIKAVADVSTVNDTKN